MATAPTTPPPGAPGPLRLFPVDAGDDPTLHVVDRHARTVVRTRSLAAAVIAAHALQPGWVVSRDRWSARITGHPPDVHVDVDGPAPIDAIRRVLAITTTTGTTP